MSCWICRKVMGYIAAGYGAGGNGFNRQSVNNWNRIAIDPVFLDELLFVFAVGTGADEPDCHEFTFEVLDNTSARLLNPYCSLSYPLQLKMLFE